MEVGVPDAALMARYCLRAVGGLPAVVVACHRESMVGATESVATSNTSSQYEELGRLDTFQAIDGKGTSASP